MKAMYAITRIDHEPSRTHAYRVTIQRRGKIHTAHFSDGVCGGKRRALAAAKAWRDSVLATEPPLSRADYCNTLRKNNRSGIPGVCHHRESIAREGGVVVRESWIARCPQDPWRTKLVKFSVAKYGNEGARRRAVKARNDALRALQGQTFAPGLRRAG
jgi:hypothetical protein